MMPRYLLDSQVFIWAHTAPKRLSIAARRTISNPNSLILLSAVSVWELCNKHIIGKLQFPQVPEKFISRIVSESGYQLLPLDQNHAFTQLQLPRIHNDPFDRMLIAQSLAENIPLITSDHEIEKYPIKTIW